MGRPKRILVPDIPAVYHCISRTALDGFPLGDVEKDYFVRLVAQLSKVYFAEIIGFSVMGNHYHLLVRMSPADQCTDDQIKKRFVRAFGEKRILVDGQIPFYRSKWNNLSEFMKELKQTFARYYNQRHNRSGFFWGNRFKSVLVEKGQTLINCLAV